MGGTIESKVKINSKFKIRNSKFEKGYTLVEMTVVMGIIAVLMTLGAGALISTRDQYILDSAVEEGITAVRDAQNRSISITQGQVEGTKAWGVAFNNNKIKLISVGGDGTNYDEATPDINQNISISSSSATFVYFASPFGTTYLTNNACDEWIDSGLATKELRPADSCSPILDPSIISFSYKNKTQSITINSRGDVVGN